MKDLVIIGGGPAGLTASVYACRQNIDFRIITDNIGGQAALSSRIENYTGYRVVSGEKLINDFTEHAEKFGVEVKQNIKAEKIEQIKEGYKVYTSDGECCEAKSLLIATGAIPKKLNAQGENKFKGKGVTYCAICDAPLFTGKDVAVIGGGNSALDAARQLTSIADKIYLITIEDELGGEDRLKKKVADSPKVKVITSGETKEIFGDNLVQGIKVDVSGEIREFEVQGVFVEIGWVPSSDFIDFVEKNEKGEIKVDQNNLTSKEGVFAAGDVTNVTKKQIIIAAGDGAKAALNAIDYINKK